MLLQESDSTGLAAGAFKSARVGDFVATALAKGGTLQLAPTGAVAFNGATLTFANGAFAFSAPLSVPNVRSTGDIFVAGNALATQVNVDALFDTIVENSVWSVNGRKGNVQLITDDILRAGGAPIRDAHFGGFNTSPTPWDFRANSDQIATTAFVQMVITQLVCSGTVITRSGPGVLTTQDINTAFAASVPPVFPTAPSPPFGDASQRIATTMFVDESVADLQEWTQHQLDLLSPAGEFAPIDSPNFTGIPTGPTAATGTTTGQLATTAFVQAAIVASTTGVSAFNTRTGAVVLLAADVTGVGGALLSSPAFVGTPSAPTPIPGDTSTRLATTAFVQAALSALPTGGVTSFNTRTGVVVLDTADITSAGGAPSNSPALTGAPTAPTAAPGDNTTNIATTAFVHAAVSALGTTVTSFNSRTGSVSLIGNDISAAGGALLVGPAFTGVPTAPTATVGTNSQQVATCAFVQNALTAMTTGVVSFNTRTGAVVLTTADITGAGGALLASPSFSGTPTAPTAAQTSNDTTLATTAFVHAALSVGNVTSFNTRTGPVTLISADVSAAGGALLASPALSGTPTAPTATAGTNTTQVATCAFVMAQLATSGGVSSFNGRAGAVTLTAADVTGAGGITNIATRVFTTSQSYVPPPGLKFAIVENIGGGAGGGGANTTAGAILGIGGGGGSGGYSRRALIAAQIGASQPITIGAAGLGGTSTPTRGGNGGTTSFGSLVVANGGGGGYPLDAAGGPATNFGPGGPGGVTTGAVGDVVAGGAPGQTGIYNNAVNTVYSGAGKGGSSAFGGGAPAAMAAAAAQSAGLNATNYGSGGSGGQVNNTSGSIAGGNGSPGVCIVTEYS